MTDISHLSPFMYYISVEIHPTRGKDYLHWLNTKHIADVVNSPWVLWGRKVALEQKADDGWDVHLVVYAFASKKEFLEYRNSDLFKSFPEQTKPFEGTFRLTRFWGQIDLVLG